MDFLSCARPEKLAARMKFEVKRHFTIRTGRIADTCRIKFIFFPYQYLQNFSVSDQKSQRRSLSTIKHVLGATGKKYFIIVLTWWTIIKSMAQSIATQKQIILKCLPMDVAYISCYKMELHVKYGKLKIILADRFIFCILARHIFWKFFTSFVFLPCKYREEWLSDNLLFFDI